MRDGALEVEFRKSEEATNALTATRFVYSEGRASGRKLVSLPLTVEPHRSKNSSRGVINCFDLRNVSDEDIADGLSEYGVTAARRILTRRGTVPTNNIILTFDTTDMPNEVRVGYIKVRVRPYVPAPMRCYRCQRFGHTKDNCRGRPTCSKCASQDHTDDTCDSETPRCVNCGEGQKPHSAYDRSCPTYVKEKEINTIKATRNLSFKEAREVYNQNHPKTSYAQKVKVTNATDASQMSVAQLVQLLKRFGLTVVATGMSALRLRPSDDEGDGEESLLPRALEVPSGSEPEDDGGLPGSALQYLRYVRREQARQSEVVTANMAGLRIKASKPKARPSPTPQRKDGCDRFGSIVRCDRMRDGALEVEFRKSEEAAKALDATRFVFSEGRASGRRLVSIPLTVEPHRSKNSSRGVINCFDLRGVSDEDIADGLADFGVTAARRIMTKRGTVSTNNIILTFDSTDLPSEIRVGYVKVRVRPFVPAPMRCFRCQRFGHTKDNCRGRPTCSKCASQDHTDETCDSETPRCVNCGEGQTPHSAYDRSCPAYVKEKEIMTIKATRNLSFKEAREVYNQSHPKTSYAQKEPAAAASGPSLSRQWQQTVESDFSGLRCRVARWKARHAPQLRRRAAQLPPAENRDACLASGPPMRCFRCQRFGHTKDNCRGRPTCSKCASQDHTDETCDSETPRCVNCGEGQTPHSAYDRSCPAYVKEKEIMTIKATRNLSFKEAREVYNQSHPKTSYAQKPPAEDRDAWLAVCRQDADGGTVDTGLAPPSLLTIAACLQSQLLALLEHLLHWSRLQGLGDGRAAWLFAVMAALEKPLPADTCAWLREAKDDTRLAAACLLICLVGRYFGQVDLADPYR
ncbi:Gem-associated protein 2 [Amphibalanus amphitrite]|uniref:Gem-associated protein 2 n=1 Tax=Amphibalanus amphitrite TaxID=1232801 RepID=A0A6A4W7F2_AMPAM|nr:Gem-associated protein 2 [Amphibalanus amphitrite]